MNLVVNSRVAIVSLNLIRIVPTSPSHNTWILKLSPIALTKEHKVADLVGFDSAAESPILFGDVP